MQANLITRNDFAEVSPHTDKAKQHILGNTGMSEKEYANFYALVTMEHLKLKAAYLTHAWNFTGPEWDALTAIWLEMFANTDPSILHEAVARFITNDRKGFFPAPGQIMGFVEEITKEREKAESDRRAREHWAEYAAHQKRVENGENCSTCRFCEHRKRVPHIATERKLFEAWRYTPLGESEKYLVTDLYCQNPQSYKYEHDYGHGTAASILCDHYEPMLYAIEDKGNVFSEVEHEHIRQ